MTELRPLITPDTVVRIFPNAVANVSNSDESSGTATEIMNVSTF